MSFHFSYYKLLLFIQLHCENRALGKKVGIWVPLHAFGTWGSSFNLHIDIRPSDAPCANGYIDLFVISDLGEGGERWENVIPIMILFLKHGKILFPVLLFGMYHCAWESFTLSHRYFLLTTSLQVASLSLPPSTLYSLFFSLSLSIFLYHFFIVLCA